MRVAEAAEREPLEKAKLILSLTMLLRDTENFKEANAYVAAALVVLRSLEASDEVRNMKFKLLLLKGEMYMLMKTFEPVKVCSSNSGGGSRRGRGRRGGGGGGGGRKKKKKKKKGGA